MEHEKQETNMMMHTRTCLKGNVHDKDGNGENLKLQTKENRSKDPWTRLSKSFWFRFGSYTPRFDLK